MGNLKNLQKWQRDIIALSMLYLILEKGKKFTTRIETEGRAAGDSAFAQPYLDEMYSNGLLDIDGITYVVTPLGHETMGRLVALYDLSEKFTIFADVDIGMDLPADIQPEDPDSAGLVNDDVFDPRFKKPTEAPDTRFVDMRIPMMHFATVMMRKELNNQSIDIHLIVFAQKLKDGELAKQDFMFRLRDGTFFAQNDHTVRHQIDWQKLGEGGEHATQIMAGLYKAGMLENLKRNGQKCSSCNIPLGTFEMWAQRESGQPLEECPRCKKSFVSAEANSLAPPTQILECPDCRTEIAPNHRKCRGCGASIKRSLPAGTISTETVVQTYEERTIGTYLPTPYGYSYYDPYVYGYQDPFWGSSYAYDPPIVYLDPFNPVADAFAFGVLCGVLL